MGSGDGFRFRVQDLVFRVYRVQQGLGFRVQVRFRVWFSLKDHGTPLFFKCVNNRAFWQELEMRGVCKLSFSETSSLLHLNLLILTQHMFLHILLFVSVCTFWVIVIFCFVRLFPTAHNFLTICHPSLGGFCDPSCHKARFLGFSPEHRDTNKMNTWLAEDRPSNPISLLFLLPYTSLLFPLSHVTNSSWTERHVFSQRGALNLNPKP